MSCQEFARRSKNLRLNERSFANHLSLIRSILIDSGQSRALREASCAKYFCTAFALHKLSFNAKIFSPSLENFLRAAFLAQYLRCKKPL
jgi:hypothetical protein